MTHKDGLSEDRLRELREEFAALLSNVGEASDGRGAVSAHYTSLSISEVVALLERRRTNEGGEPVAWMMTAPGCEAILTANMRNAEYGAVQGWDITPLYASPSSPVAPEGVRGTLLFAQSELAEAADKFWVIHCNHPGKAVGRAQGEDKEFCATMSERMTAAHKKITAALSALTPAAEQGETDMVLDDAAVERIVQAVRPYTHRTLFLDEHRSLVRSALAAPSAKEA
jgi:hypothetical protein